MPALVNNLLSTTAIVDGEGRPTPYFMRQWLSQGVVNEDVTGLQPQIDAILATTLTAGVGLSGGGDLSANRTFDLENTAVTSGTYGDADNVAQITVDAQGRITAAADVPITGGGGGGGGAWVLLSEVAFTDVASNNIDWDDPELYSEIEVHFESITASVDGDIMLLRARQGGTTRTGATDYERLTTATRIGAAAIDNAASTSVFFLPGQSASPSGLGFSAGESLSGVLTIEDPGDTVNNKMVRMLSTHVGTDGRLTRTDHAGLLKLNTDPLDGITFGTNASGLLSGVMRAYGLLKAPASSGAGAIQFISSHTVASATDTFIDVPLSADFDLFQIRVLGFLTTTPGRLFFRVSDDGGTTFVASADYTDQRTNAQTAIELTDSVNNVLINGPFAFMAELNRQTASPFNFGIVATLTAPISGSSVGLVTGGSFDPTGVPSLSNKIDAFQMLTSNSADMDDVTIYLYGVALS